MSREKLGPEAIKEAMSGLDGWKVAGDGSSMSRTFIFKNFSEAFAFIDRKSVV